ncbi:MAG: MarR family winged helix-turn-helix transcriptional regulator [Gaiellaceae bacterium]
MRWLRTHAALTRELSADLVAAHGLTINDYEVLLHLAKAENRVLKPVALAERIVLTPSGITRLLAGLERAGFVERVSCSTDRRVSYAKLTSAGHARLRKASKTHLAGIERVFTGRFSGDELETLGELLARLPGGDSGGECTAE